MPSRCVARCSPFAPGLGRAELDRPHIHCERLDLLGLRSVDESRYAAWVSAGLAVVLVAVSPPVVRRTAVTYRVAAVLAGVAVGGFAAWLAFGRKRALLRERAREVRRLEGEIEDLKTCDRVLAAARECRAVVTAEEHMVNGGLGEAVAGVIAQAGIGTRFKIVGIPDEYTVTGSQADIFRHYGLTMEGLAATAQALLAVAAAH